MAALVDDGFETTELDDRAKAIIAYTDAVLAASPPSADTAAALREHFDEAQIVELALGISLFHGFSKIMISLGLEPAQMETTVRPTPDTADVG